MGKIHKDFHNLFTREGTIFFLKFLHSPIFTFLHFYILNFLSYLRSENVFHQR